MTRARRSIVLFFVLFLCAVLGNWNNTSTGIELDKLPRLPLAKIRSGWLKDESTAGFDGITARAGGGASVREVRLSGTGKSGKRWEAHLWGLDEVWRADLDGNGTQDYVLFASGPYFNGRTTPLFSLVVLLMDSQGLPVPFFTVVYHGENGDGIKHFVDLNRDKHAELLISSYDENVSDPKVGVFCSGHWTTQLYRFKDSGAEEVRGMAGELNFPFVHDWSYRGTLCAEAERPLSSVQPVELGDHGTSRNGELQTSILAADGVDRWTISPVGGCKAVSYQVAVFDRPAIREIAFPNPFHDYSANLVDRIRSQNVPVRLRGVNKEHDDCRVNLLWAAAR